MNNLLDKSFWKTEYYLNVCTFLSYYGDMFVFITSHQNSTSKYKLF